MSRKLAPALAVAAAAVPLGAAGQGFGPADSSSASTYEGKLDFRVGTLGPALAADMKLIEQHGQTKVLPRFTSSWTGLELLDVKTVLAYGDLNTSMSGPKVDTNIVVRSGVSFVDKIEAALHRNDGATRQSLGLRFSRLDTGVDVLGGDPLAFRADMTFNRSADRSAASSSLTSSWGLGEALTMQSVLHLDGDRASGFERSGLDTKIVYRSPFAFIDRFEGEIRDGPDRRESLAVLLPELFGGDEHGTSFSVTGKALIREILDPTGAETRSLGFETKLQGFMPPLLGGRNALSLKIERGLGAEDARSSSLAYDHSWSPGSASIGLNLKMLRDLDEVEPSMDLSWSAQF